MRRTDLIAVACVALVFWPQIQGGMIPQDVKPTAAPSAELQAIVAPLAVQHLVTPQLLGHHRALALGFEVRPLLERRLLELGAFAPLRGHRKRQH